MATRGTGIRNTKYGGVGGAQERDTRKHEAAGDYLRLGLQHAFWHVPLPRLASAGCFSFLLLHLFKYDWALDIFLFGFCSVGRCLNNMRSEERPHTKKLVSFMLLQNDQTLVLAKKEGKKNNNTPSRS